MGNDSNDSIDSNDNPIVEQPEQPEQPATQPAQKRVITFNFAGKKASPEYLVDAEPAPAPASAPAATPSQPATTSTQPVATQTTSTPAQLTPTPTPTISTSWASEIVTATNASTVEDWRDAITAELTRNARWMDIASTDDTLTTIRCTITGQPIGVTSSAENADPSLVVQGKIPQLLIRSQRDPEVLAETAPIAALAYLAGNLTTALAREAVTAELAVNPRLPAVEQVLIEIETRGKVYDAIARRLTPDNTPDYADALDTTYGQAMLLSQLLTTYNNRIRVNHLTAVQNDGIIKLWRDFIAEPAQSTQPTLSTLSTQLTYALCGLTLAGGREALHSQVVDATRHRLTSGFFYYSGDEDGNYPASASDWINGFRIANNLNITNVLALPSRQRASIERAQLSAELRMKSGVQRSMPNSAFTITHNAVNDAASKSRARKKSARTVQIEREAAELFAGIDMKGFGHE